MNKYVLEREPMRLVVRLTPIGRWMLGLRVGAITMGVSLAGLAVFYLPDFVADYANRGAAFRSFFGFYLLGLAGFVGLVAGIMRGLAKYSWTLDGHDGLVRWWSRTPLGRVITDELELHRVAGVELVRGDGWGATRELVLLLDDGERAVVAFGAHGLDRIRDAIADTLDEARASISR